MIRSEFCLSLAEEYLSIPEATVGKAVSVMFETITEALMQRDRVEIRGFGSFSTRLRQPRAAHNPQTGKWTTTEEKYAIYFRAGDHLSKVLNEAAARGVAIQENADHE